MTREEFDELQDVVIEMRELLDTKISFGYIGNIWHGPYCDDRCWYVWLDDFPPGIQSHLNNRPSVCVGTADDHLDAPMLRKRIISTFYRMRAIVEERKDLIGFRYALTR